MKTITINVNEPIYDLFAFEAKRSDRNVSQLIREAMERYAREWLRPRRDLRDLTPISLGEMKVDSLLGDDLLGEMLE